MMQFEYSLLEALSAVIREGTFEAAARTLNVTQSAVSQRIKLLEERTGAVLIVRGRPCVATEYGQQLCRHVEQVHLLEYDLSKNLKAIHNPTAAKPATIRISVNSDSLATWFPTVVRRAGAELNLYFDVIPDDQEHTAQRLRSGEALAAVTTTETPLQGCRRSSLGAMEYIGVASPEFMERYFSSGVTLETLSAAPTLVFDRKDTLNETWLNNAFGETTQMSGHMIPSFEGYIACCQSGAGWGVVPRTPVEADLIDGSLIELKPGSNVSVSLHWQTSAQRSEIMKLLTAIVVDVSRQQMQPDQFRAA